MSTYKIMIEFGIQSQIAYIGALSKTEAIYKAYRRYPHIKNAYFFGYSEKPYDFS